MSQTDGQAVPRASWAHTPGAASEVLARWRLAFGASVAAALVLACAPKQPTDGPATSSTEETVTTVTGTVPKQLRVVTAAAQCPISTDCSRSWTNQFVKAVFKEHDPDIVIMTEFFWNGTYNNMIDEVQRQRPNTYNFYRGPKDGFFTGWGGTVIASKYVMSEKQEHEYDACSLPDSATAKGVIFARQNIGTLAGATAPVFVDVVATHHQASTVGDFVATIRDQMNEQRDFLKQDSTWGRNGLAAGTTNTTLKVYSGDLNVSGDGPTWLVKNGHGEAPGAGKNAFAWLTENVFKPIGLRDATQTCAGGPDAAKACSERPFTEVECWEVIKQMYLPYARLEQTRDAAGAVTGETGVYMIAQQAASFATGSDHPAKEITYGLFLRKSKVVPADPVVALKDFCAKSPLHPSCTQCGDLKPPQAPLADWEGYVVAPRMKTEAATALGAGDVRGSANASCAPPSLIQYNAVLDQSYCCPVDPGIRFVWPESSRAEQCALYVPQTVCEQTKLCVWRNGQCVPKSSVRPEAYFYLSLSGDKHDYEAPADQITATYLEGEALVWIQANGTRMENGRAVTVSQAFQIDSSRIAVGATQPLTGLGLESDMSRGGLSFEPAGVVTITEYGPTGGFLAGTLSGVGSKSSPPYEMFQVQGSFRVKRTW